MPNQMEPWPIETKIQQANRHIKQIKRNLEEGEERYRSGQYTKAQWDYIRKDGKRAHAEAVTRLKDLQREKSIVNP